MTAPDLTAFIEACRAPMLHNVFVTSQDLDTEDQFETSAYALYKDSEGDLIHVGVTWGDGPEFGFFPWFELGDERAPYDSHPAIRRLIREYDDDAHEGLYKAVNAMINVYEAAHSLIPADGLSAEERDALLEMINAAADPLDQEIEIEDDDEYDDEEVDDDESDTVHGFSQALDGFLLEQSGLIVFAGGPGSGRTTSAYALVERIVASGLPAVAISTGPVVDSSVRHRPVNHCGDIPDAVRAEMAAGTAVLLVDSDQDADSLSAMVDAVTEGALVIATLDNRGTDSYIHLLNLIESAEDWGGHLRGDFDAWLYAVITQALIETPAGPTLTAELRPGRMMQK